MERRTTSLPRAALVAASSSTSHKTKSTFPSAPFFQFSIIFFHVFIRCCIIIRFYRYQVEWLYLTHTVECDANEVFAKVDQHVKEGKLGATDQSIY